MSIQLGRRLRARLPPLDQSLLQYLRPALLFLIPLLGLHLAYSIVRAALPPAWFPGVNAEQAGSKVHDTTTKEEALGRKDVLDGVKEYDVIIVGGGTTGCVLAARLSEDPNISVLALEAGHSDTLQLFSRIPASFARLFGHASADYNFWTQGGETALGVKGRSLRWPRARMLGGCSAINAMICHHCSPSDFDEIASRISSPSWSYASLAPYFAKSQTAVPSPSWPAAKHPVPAQARGKTGPVKIGYSFINNLSLAFVQACGTVGIKIRDDLNTDGDGTGEPGATGTLGVSRGQTFIHNGERVSTATAYLTPDVIARPNLTVAVGATVTRILFSDATPTSPPRAIGVEFVSLDIPFPTSTAPRTLYRAKAKKEVILTAGSIGSPHVLKVSGVGPREELEKVGIKVVFELPGVGENLKDHLGIGMFFTAKKGTSLHFITNPLGGLGALVEWLRYRTGPMTTNVCEAIAFVRSTDDSLAKSTGIPKPDIKDSTSGGVGPDIELIQSPFGFANHGVTAPVSGTDFYSIGAIHLRPQSTGVIHIISPDIFVKPTIEPRLFSHNDDVKACVWALKLCHKVAESEPLASMLEEPYNAIGWPIFPDVHKFSDEELGEWVRGHAETLYHPVGTVKLGAKEEMGCLDAEMRVYGVAGLRVCDASVFPEQLSGHPMAPLIAIAEKFAEELRRELSV